MTLSTTKSSLWQSLVVSFIGEQLMLDDLYTKYENLIENHRSVNLVFLCYDPHLFPKLVGLNWGEEIKFTRIKKMMFTIVMPDAYIQLLALHRICLIFYEAGINFISTKKKSKEIGEARLLCRCLRTVGTLQLSGVQAESLDT
jgi:hypothetical protein